MPYITWDGTALQDLERIYNYRADRNPVIAARVLQAIVSEIRILERFPNSGRLLDESEGYSRREWVVRFQRMAYMIIYKVRHESVVVVSVRDSRKEDRVLLT